MTPLQAQFIEWGVSNAGWIIAAWTLWRSIQRDSRARAVSDAVTQEELANLRKASEELRDSIAMHSELVRSMDHRFWSEKWPLVERTAARVEGLSERVEDHERRILRLEPNRSS